MKRTIAAIFTVAILALTSLSQSKDEQEILRINKALEKAYKSREAAAFEANLAPDYTMSNPSGKLYTRAEVFEDLKNELAKPTIKNLDESSNDLKVKIIGDVAYVTGNWKSTTQPYNDATVEPHTDKGRMTAIYEKRGGKWLLVHEHYSEAPHDRKLMEKEVLKASADITQAMKVRDKATYEKMLHEDYIYTDEAGKFYTRAEHLSKYPANLTVNSVEVTNQKVSILGNGSALETGIYLVKGTSGGKAFEENGRFSTIWLWRDGRWQVMSDHISMLKK